MRRTEENKPPLEEIKAPSYAEAKARMENIVAAAVIDFVQQWGGGIRCLHRGHGPRGDQDQSWRQEHPAEDAAE